MASKTKKRKPARKRKAKPKLICRTRYVKVKGRRRKVRTCKPAPRRKQVPKAGYKPTKPAFPPAFVLPAPVAAVDPLADPAPGPLPQHGAFGPAQAERLLWRAGFGPRPGDVERLVALGLDGAVRSLTEPQGAAQLVGPAPRDDDGNALAPLDLWGHDHLWWLDRMVRSDQPLVERMTLILHDWFATSSEKVQTNLLLQQNELLRTRAFGSFATLLREITIDPAMLVFLDGIYNTRWDPNENYAREVMELFTLGANRGAYTEADIRNAARALTGWTASWVDDVGLVNFRYVASRHDTTNKTVFGETGNLGWEDVVRLCLHHPLHASFFVTKLWSYFIPTPPDPATQGALQALYVSSGHQIKPVLEAILKHPDLYGGQAMVKPPIVFLAGTLRSIGRGVDTTAWAWMCDNAGQVLFRPPNVSGWDDTRWLDTSTWRGRWELTAQALYRSRADVWAGTYDATEDAPTAVARALAHLGNPRISADTAAVLANFAATSIPATLAGWQERPYRAMRQNALRMLIATSSDLQTS